MSDQFEGELTSDRQRTKFTPQDIRQIVNLVDAGRTGRGSPRSTARCTRRADGAFTSGEELPPTPHRDRDFLIDLT
jgi:hypothetical protein